MTDKKTIGIIALILLFSLFLRIPYLFHTLQDIDEGSHAAIATTLLDGGLPYLHAVDNKPPGIFYIYAATFFLFGDYNMTAIHSVTYLWTLATAIILSIFARKQGGKTAALLTLLFYLTFTAALYPKMIAANTEIFMALPYSLGVLLLWHACAREKISLHVLAGFVSGLSVLFKQVGGVLICAAFLYLLVALPMQIGRKRILPGFAAFSGYAIGFFLPLALLTALFHKHGILKDWFFWNVTYPNRYIDAGSATLSLPSQIAAEFIPFLLSTIILWLLAFLWIRRTFADRDPHHPSPIHHFPIFIMLWLAGSIAVTLLGKRMFGHYFIQILPPLTLMAALFAGRFFGGHNRPPAKYWRMATVALTLVPGLVFTGMAISFEAATDTWGEINPDFRPAAEYIKNHTQPQDEIFVWGWFTPLYVYSERAPSTRFVFTTIHTGYRQGNDPNEKDRADIAWLQIPEAWPMLEADLIRNPPELIVDTSPGNYHDFGRYPILEYPVLRSFIRNNCSLEKRIAGTGIYRCNTLRPSQEEPAPTG